MSYTIEVTNEGKEASFEVETYGYVFLGDVHIVYDYLEDYFYDRSSGGTISYLNLYDHPEYLQPTPPRDFTCTNASQTGQYPHFTWNSPSDPIGVSFKYEIYRKENWGSYSCVASGITATNWTDYDVVINPNGNRYYYYAKAYTDQSPKSQPSNTAWVRGYLIKGNPEKPEVQLLEPKANQNTINFALSAYPNPFNPFTTLAYELPTDGLVSLKVYDVAGREVLELVQDLRTAGRYQVEFNGSQYSSGVYLAILQFDQHRRAQKMLLIK